MGTSSQVFVYGGSPLSGDAQMNECQNGTLQLSPHARYAYTLSLHIDGLPDYGNLSDFSAGLATAVKTLAKAWDKEVEAAPAALRRFMPTIRIEYAFGFDSDDEQEAYEIMMKTRTGGLELPNG